MALIEMIENNYSLQLIQYKSYIIYTGYHNTNCKQKAVDQKVCSFTVAEERIGVLTFNLRCPRKTLLAVSIRKSARPDIFSRREEHRSKFPS